MRSFTPCLNDKIILRAALLFGAALTGAPCVAAHVSQPENAVLAEANDAAQPVDAAETPPETAAVEKPLEEQPIDLVAIDVSGNSLLDQRQIETAIYPFTGPGRTLADVEKARKALETAYHTLGYQTVVVSIPPQDGRDGIVELQVVEARIGTVKIAKNKHVPVSAIRRGIPELREGTIPNITRMQAQLAEQNRVSDRSIIPLLAPSVTPGLVDAELEVEDKLPIHGSVELTNDHNANTRPLRLNATIKHSDLWNLGHSVSASYIVAPQAREQSEVFSGSYVAPILGTPWTLTLYGYSSNSTVPALGGARVLGNGYSIGGRASLTLPSKGSFWHSLSFGVNYNEFDEVIDLGTTQDRAPIAYVPITVGYTAGRYSDRSSSSATFSATAGVRGSGSNEDLFAARSFATGNFVRINLDANHQQQLGSDFSAVMRLSAQMADSHLVSGEQFSGGGLDTVRGFLQSSAVGDNGVIGSIEFRLPSIADKLGKFVDRFQPFLFADGAYTHVINASAGQEANAWLASVGGGLELGFFETLSGQIVIGFPVKRPAGISSDPITTFTVKAGF